MESSIFSLVVQLVVYEIILRRKTDYWSVTVYETAESCLDKKGPFYYRNPIYPFVDISFQEYVLKGISHPVFYGDLVYKLRRVKDTPNIISSGSKIVKRLRRRQYDPMIIERTAYV